MSAYIQFFIRVKDNFAPIYTSSRSSEVYQAFDNFAPWEKITPVTYDTLKLVRESVNDQIDHYKESIRKAQDKIEFLKGVQMDIEERMERYDDEVGFITDLRDYIEEKEYVLSFCAFLQSCLDEAREDKEWSSNPLGFDPAGYIYVGIEVGTPTIEDLEV